MMTRGTKRLAGSDSSAPDSSDPALQSKRVMGATHFDVHRAEPSHQHPMAEPKLDMQRAQLCHLHVRALNTQYASWVQSQLQNHPDELWQDGAQDYITHASHIVEKFSDVVAWLRANAPRAESMQTTALPNNQKILVDGEDSSKSKSQPFVKSGPPTGGIVSQTLGLWSSSVTSGNQKPVFSALSSGDQKTVSSSVSSGDQKPVFSGLSSGDQKPVFSGLSSGDQNPVFLGYQGALAKPETSEDQEEENELEKPSSPSLKRTEEKGIVIVHEVKCKLYVKPDDLAEKGWKDMGVGQLSIKCKEGAAKGTKDLKPTIIVRNDVGKILLNALIYPGIKMNVQKNTIASVFHTTGSGSEAGKNAVAVARTYLLRMKTEEEAAKLADAIKEYTPST